MRLLAALRSSHGIYSRRSASSYLPLFLAAPILMAPSLYGQSATVGGQVIDPSGALVRDVQITLTNDLTNTTLRAKSNKVGIYTVPFVSPGKYTLRAEAPGFSPYTQTGIVLTTAQNLELDFRIAVGGNAQSVTVSGSGNEINTTDASVSTVVDRQFVENIPLNGRSFQSLMSMVPGVTIVPVQSNQGSGEISVNGQRTESNYFTVDGVSANTGTLAYTPGFSAGYGGSLAGETVLGTTQSMVSIDDLQEFRATTSTYSAEYGRSPGGQFTFSTRSGTNALHGSAFDYLRNAALDANNWFNNYYGEARQAEKQNDFGGTLGGPVFLPKLYNGKDKTFFFFSYEGLRLRQPQAAQQYEVPSVALRTNAPAALQPILNGYPLPNGGASSGDGLAYFTSGYMSPSTLDTTSVRIDHTFSDRFKVFGRYNYAPSSNVSRYSSDLANVIRQQGNVKVLTLGSTNILNSHVSNEARFNLTWNGSNQQFSVDDFGGSKPLNITDFPGLTNTDWLFFCVDYSTYPCTRFASQVSTQRQWNVTDTVIASVGRHTLKLGIDYRRLENHASQPKNYGVVGFLDEASFYTNLPGFFGAYHHTTSTLDPIYTNFSAFVQDEWKITDRLNASVGLRWELNPAPHDAKGNDPYGVTSTNLATLTLAPQGTPLWKTTHGNFAPRIGVTYQLNEQPGHETVLRVGTGLFYDTSTINASGGYFFGAGLTSRTDFVGQQFPLSANQLAALPAPTSAPPYAMEIYGFDPNLKLPYVWQWNVALQQALGSDQSLTLSYVASAGRKLLLQKEYDPSISGNTQFAAGGLGLYLTTNSASSDYDSLQVQFLRRLSHGLQASLSYTWSHAFDDATSNFQVYTVERASSDNDIRNNFQAALTYNIPGAYSNHLASAILGQWAVDARVSARSALPLDLFGSYAVDSTGATVQFHPNKIAGQPLYLNKAGVPGGRLVNYNAFTVATDSNGNAIEGNFARNGARGFDAVQGDVALRREFAFTDRVGLQFRAEAFNVLNHAIYGSIYNSLDYGSDLFGMAYQTGNGSLGGLSPIYQVGGPRSLQVALRLHF